MGVASEDELPGVAVDVAVVELGSDDWANECCATALAPTPAAARSDRLAPPTRRRRWMDSVIRIEAAPNEVGSSGVGRHAHRQAAAAKQDEIEIGKFKG
jgi:hypothetical protein